MGIVSVSGLGKAYKQYPNRWARLLEWLLPSAATRHNLKWVLRDVSFAVNRGEALGIVGMNGAGKSTLLKLITGTAQASAGQINISGRVAALLELGMGFHNDFTGRQNAYMAGQLQGLSMDEITRLMPEIEAFAEIGEYIDRPLRIYSSGMQMRLAFSVATACRPDVLIVDEALSVGDAYFQHKSFDRIRQFRQQGTTLLLVSHDRTAILSICDSVILLNDGALLMHGQPEAVMDYYSALLAEREHQATVSQRNAPDGAIQTVSGSGEAQLADIVLLNAGGERVDVVEVGTRVTLSVSVGVHAAIPRLVLGYMIKDRYGQSIYGTNTDLKGEALHALIAGETVHYAFSFDADLGAGSYSISIALHETETHLTRNYHFVERAYLLSIVNRTHQPFAGCAWLDPEVVVTREESRAE